MNNSPFQKWLQHPTYFLFWIVVGSVAWSFSFNNTETQKVEQSSVAIKTEINEVVPEIEETNYNEMVSLSDEEVLRLALSTENENSFNSEKNPYALTPEEIQALEYPAEATNLSASTFSYLEISDSTIKFEFENPKDSKVCPASRLHYEKFISQSKALQPWLKTRDPESNSLPRNCMTHIMNSMSLGKSSLGICSKALGAVRTGGAKPCVSENMVNVTYNAYVDVMECLNLNPKLYLPKISRESGFLINAYGVGKDGGIGQFTQPAIEAVNRVFPQYIKQIQDAAATKPSCARILEMKTLLGPAPTSSVQRCSMIAAPENPIRNILYIGIFNRLHMDMYSGIQFVAGQDYISKNGAMIPVKNNHEDEFEGEFKRRKFKEKLEQLGIKNPNMHFFKDLLTIAGYNMGSPTALRLLDKYLELIIRAKKPLTNADFDFNTKRFANDVDGDGKSKNVIEIARSYVMSSQISTKDSQAVKNIKIKKRKELPKRWAASYLRTFPEFLTYNANAYDGKVLGKFDIYGAPGYASFVAYRNQEFRDLFKNAGIDPDFCSDPNFLKF